MSRFETVLITGANRGIGFEFVKHFSQHAKRVIACCRDPEKASELKSLESSKPNIEIHTLDVTNNMQIEALEKAFQGQTIDLLINNAGIYGPKHAESQLDKAIWSKVFEVNVMAPIQIARALSNNLKHSTNAVVANISSKMGSITDNGSGGASIYRSSKAALNAATKSFALDYASQGITTILLHPGWVQTDIGGQSALINTQTSIQGMSAVLENTNQSKNGLFFNYDGDIIPW